MTTGVGTTVTGSYAGIRAFNDGTGALTVTANGDVSAPYGIGIHALNSLDGTDLTVTTGVGTAVTGTFGIQALNNGTRALSVTADGDVAGFGLGIYARNFGTDLSITTGAGTTISSNNLGIQADNRGTGALTVVTNGDVTGTGYGGIYAINRANGTSLSVTTGAGTATTAAMTEFTRSTTERARSQLPPTATSPGPLAMASMRCTPTAVRSTSP